MKSWVCFVRAQWFIILIVTLLGVSLTACAPRSKRFYVNENTGGYTAGSINDPKTVDLMIDEVKPTPIVPDSSDSLPNRLTQANTPSSRSHPNPAVIHDNVTTGIAAYYNDNLNGRPTASGEIYDRNKLTAAHRTLPFGTRVRVTNQQNGASVIVRINDRGPTNRQRIIDLSYAAAEAIGMLKAGVIPVKLEVLD